MSSPASVHLLVLVHGLWGSVEHLAALAEVIKETHSKSGTSDVELDVLVAEGNQNFHTYDGIDWGAERVVEEIDARIAAIEKEGAKKVTRFSITGYSLGGLLSRYIIGILYHRKFFDNVTPANFNTFATPHLGIPRFRSFISGLFNAVGARLLSRTGEQFYAVDKWTDDKPLLEVLAEKDSIFFKALSEFKNIQVYANAVNDRTVPYVTAAMEVYDPFLERETNGITLKMDDKYEALIDSMELPDTPPPIPKGPSFFSAEYFKSRKSSGPRLPPFLQFRFPLNILFYLSIPLLLPIVLGVVIVRFSIETRSSRKRIKILEKADPQRKRLGVMDRLNQELDEAVMDMVGANDGATHSSDDEELPTTTAAAAQAKKDADKSQPILTPAQKRMIENLNSIPHLKKNLLFFDQIANSHGTIVCRDLKKFEFHKRGLGGLQHWADHFEL